MPDTSLIVRILFFFTFLCAFVNKCSFCVCICNLKLSSLNWTLLRGCHEAVTEPPLPPLVLSGGHKGVGSARQVEKLLQHPGSAAGAETEHDVKREQQALPATRRPGVQQLRPLPVLPWLSHTPHTYTHTNSIANADSTTFKVFQESQLPLPYLGASH